MRFKVLNFHFFRCLTAKISPETSTITSGNSAATPNTLILSHRSSTSALAAVDLFPDLPLVTMTFVRLIKVKLYIKTSGYAPRGL